jgi:hypothetical protein
VDNTPRFVRKQIRRVAAALRQHWDPIGGGSMPDLPTDEYDGYAPSVVGLIRRGADDLHIARHLAELERVSMGLSPSPPERLLPVVRELRRAAAE